MIEGVEGESVAEVVSSVATNVMYNEIPDSSSLVFATPGDGTVSLALTADEVENIRTSTFAALHLSDVLCVHRHRSNTSSPTATLDPTAVFSILKEALASSATSFCSRAAQTWADGFVFPPEAKEGDATLLRQCGGDFDALWAIKRAMGAADKLSPARVKSTVRRRDLTDRKDYGRLMCIARGIEIETLPTFRPSGGTHRPPMRTKYTRDVPNAVNKLLHKQWLKSTVLLLPTALVALIEGIHYSYQHWTVKAGKAEGRTLCDTSNGAPGEQTLNGNTPAEKETLRQMMIKRWGRIEHPTLHDLVLMVLEAADLHGWENIELWKMDLAGAFNLMDFSAASAKLLAFELTEGMTVIHTTGMFGWTGTPYVFQVITRVLCDLCRPLLFGSNLMYVDDMFGAVHRNHRAQDMAAAAKVIRQLLGHGAVAEEKSAFGRSTDLLGWNFDLDTRSVSASMRNMLKAIHTFFNTDLDGPVTLKEVERMASYASRYAVLSRPMKPYTAALHADAALFAGNHHERPRHLSRASKCDIIMWRAYLCLLRLDPKNFARPLESFRDRRASVLIEYDASLTALGVGVSVRNETTDLFELRAYSSLILPYETNMDSSYQNTKEYSAVLLGLALIKQEHLVPNGFAYNVCGDNTTSLSWVDKERAASSLARRANIGTSLLTADLDAYIAETKHIPGVDNTVYDGLSRGKKGTDLGLPAQLEIVLYPHSMSTRYIALCNPHLFLDTAEEHIALSRKMLSMLGAAGTDPSIHL
jgi:hypothetical protein